MNRHCFMTIFLSVLLAGALFADTVPSFSRNVIKIASKAQINLAWKHVWEDLNSDGLVDLLVVSPAGDVFVYYQQASGFSGTATQSWTLPENTAWFKVADVSEEPNAEIVISTGDGIKYYAQSDGVFRTAPKMLIEAGQVFEGATIRSTSYFGTKWYWGRKVGSAIPVILADKVLLYEPDGKGHYKISRTIELEHKSHISKWDQTRWSLAGKTASEIYIDTSATDKPDPNSPEAPQEENDYIRKMTDKVKGRESQGIYIVTDDINGDSRKDVTLLHVMQNIDLKTNFMIFFRREDGTIAEEPDQILRCRGMPAEGDYPGPTELSPFIDIDKDGLLDIVMVELKERPVSVWSFVKILVARGIDWTLTVRLYNKETGFAGRPDFSLDVTSVLPASEQFMDFANFDGDFNGDGRPDIILRRSAAESHLYLSSAKAGFYHPEPQLKLDVPPEGWTFVKDLNGDGLSDIYLVDSAKAEIIVFLSERPNKKGAAR